MGIFEQLLNVKKGDTVTTLLIYTLFTIALIPIVTWFIKRHKRASIIDKIPGVPTLPILGNALEVNLEPRLLFKKIIEFCSLGKPLFRMWIAWKPYVIISDAKSTEIVLGSSKLITKSGDYDFLHPWLGTGLLTSTGRKWHSRRKLLTPAFHYKILDDFLDVFNSHSFTLVNKLDKYDSKPVFNVFPIITLCTLDIILETAMGVNINAQNNKESKYVDALYKVGAMVQYRQARPWIYSDVMFYLLGYKTEHDRLVKHLHDFSYKTIRERREFIANNGFEETETKDDIGKKRRLAFLDLLLDYSESGPSDSKLTDEDIREEVDTFMFEGHDTTAAAINWTLYLVATHPHVQTKVKEEMDRIFEGSDRAVTSADLREMKYLEMCIKEGLRLFPSVPFLGREVTEDVKISGYEIPKGTSIVMVTYKLHRDPVHFPDPEKFDPERFTSENSSKRHPYAYVPFSAGPRNCIGQKFALMEEKVVLCHILRNYKVSSKTPRDDLKLIGELILRPEDGNFITLTKY